MPFTPNPHETCPQCKHPYMAVGHQRCPSCGWVRGTEPTPPSPAALPGGPGVSIQQRIQAQQAINQGAQK